MNISNAQSPKVYGSPTCASFTPIISRSSLSALCDFLEEIECVPEFTLSIAGELYLKQQDGRFIKCPEEFATWIVSLETQRNPVAMEKELERTEKHQATQTQAETVSLDDVPFNATGTAPANFIAIDVQTRPELSGQQSGNLQQRFRAINSDVRANLLAISDLPTFMKACYLQMSISLQEHIIPEGKAHLYRIQAGGQTIAETKSKRRGDAVFGGQVKAVEFLDPGIMEDWRRRYGDPLKR